MFLLNLGFVLLVELFANVSDLAWVLHNLDFWFLERIIGDERVDQLEIFEGFNYAFKDSEVC